MPPPQSRRRVRFYGVGSKAAVIGAAVLAGIAVVVAGYRIRTALSRGPVLLRLGDDVPLGPVPPLSNDRDAQRYRLAALQRALAQAQASDRAALWTALGGMALQAGDPYAAQIALKRALRPDAANVTALERLGRAQVSLGLFQDAVSTWRALIALEPGRPAGAIELSRTLTVLGRRSDAAAVLEKAEQTLSSTDVAGRGALIREYDRRGELARALQLSRNLVEAAPADPGAQFLLAMLLFKTQRLAEAEPLLERLVAGGSRQVQVRRYLAAVLLNPLSPHRDARRAEHLLLEAANLEPGDGGPLLDLATLYAEQGRARAAAHVLTRLLELSPTSATARLQLGHAFGHLGMREAAQTQEELARRLFARNREAEALRTQIDHRPTDASARLAFGLHFMRWGEFGRALPELEAAFCLSMYSSKARNALSAYYRALDLPPPSYLRGAPR
ncbi:MAG: tetratricopeptide repeat protein [Chthonomonadales bacterium]